MIVESICNIFFGVVSFLLGFLPSLDWVVNADAVGACVLWLARVPIRLFCARCPIAESRALSTH